MYLGKISLKTRVFTLLHICFTLLDSTEWLRWKLHSPTGDKVLQEEALISQMVFHIHLQFFVFPKVDDVVILITAYMPLFCRTNKHCHWLQNSDHCHIKVLSSSLSSSSLNPIACNNEQGSIWRFKQLRNQNKKHKKMWAKTVITRSLNLAVLLLWG